MSEECPASGLSPQQQDQVSDGAADLRAKRNSGLFALFRWFKPVASRESIDSLSGSSSCDSLASLKSAGTVASFSFVPPIAYSHEKPQKVVTVGPETDTYRLRLQQRDNRREKDKDITLRKKYKLFFHKESLLRPDDLRQKEQEENSKSLPLLPRLMGVEEEKVHRRTNSESSKIKRAGAYVHVKGKRRAPQPPSQRQSFDGSSIPSLRRKKRLAPPPPDPGQPVTKVLMEVEEVLCNDSLKLDHGILKPTKVNAQKSENNPNAARSSYSETPVSPRPWYKRNITARESKKEEKGKTDSVVLERLPDVQFGRNLSLDLTLEEAGTQSKKKKELETRKKDEKRKSGLSFLTNISELDREASEIVRNKDFDRTELQNLPATAMPEFMRLKECKNSNTDSWSSPNKRRSAKDLIAKFNAITNVTRVTVFGVPQRDKYFSKQVSLDETRQRQEALLESHKKRIEEIDRKKEERISPLMKSESANAIKKPETPKIERKAWKCPKCYLENEYWRIICHVCSTIKPYFDDFSSNKTETKIEAKTSSPIIDRKDHISPNISPERIIERSKTQIGFSALASYNKVTTPPEKGDTIKKEEKEKLKKMLIEMKNSLPKRKSHITPQQNNRQSIIMENLEEPVEGVSKNIGDMESDDKISNSSKSELTVTKDNILLENSKESLTEKTQEEKIAEILIGTKTTIYENIKIRKTDNPKPVKVSSAAQTNSVVKKRIPVTSISPLLEEKHKKFELMRPKDFEEIYSDKSAISAARVYANLARNDDLSLFFNIPKNFTDIKNNMRKISTKNADTIAINRLLKKLETSIAKGELTEASMFAKELAELKVNCSVVRQKTQKNPEKNDKTHFLIDLYIEDKISHRGPFAVEVSETQTVVELKKQIEQEFEIPAEVQRWILGKELVTNDNASLKDHNIIEGCPVFLYLVAPNLKTASQEGRCLPKESCINLPSSSKINNHSDQLKSTNNNVFEAYSNKENIDLMYSPKIVNLIRKEPENTKEPHKIQNISKENENIDEKGNKELVHFVNKTKSNMVKVSSPNNKNTSDNVEQFNTDSKSSTSKPPTVETYNDSPESCPKEGGIPEEDTKTLKPAKEWECHLCTLLNPTSSNVCAICATVRLNNISPPKKSLKRKAPQPVNLKDQTYIQLVNLDNADLVENIETFECVICFLDIFPTEGVTLRECLHQFCKICLAHHIEYSEEAEIKCPYRDNDYSCNIALQDREIKALVQQHIYEQHLAKSMKQAENRMEKTFHCKSPDCKGWCIFEDNVNEFRCPVCRKTNCLTCQSIHMGLNCKQYQEKTMMDSEVDDNAKRTKEMLEDMVRKGEALSCPTCQVVLMKKWGCDWVRCSVCRTEICWVTRGPRWGPDGKGDTSGGCKCGVNGVKCHPKCNYCH